MAIDLNAASNDYGMGTFKIGKGALAMSGGPSLNWGEAAKLGAPVEFRVALPPTLPHTAGLSPARIYDTYAEYVQGAGSAAAKCALASGEQVIVGLRVPRSTRVNQGLGTYEDRIALIWQDKPPSQAPRNNVRCVLPSVPAYSTPKGPDDGGLKHGWDFKANTVPTAQYEDPPFELITDRSPKTGKVLTRKKVIKIIDPRGREIAFREREGRDVNKDGRLDLGQLVPGTYTFHFGKSVKLGPVLRGDSSQTVQRDVNHDGEFTLADVWQTDKGETLVDTGDFSILLHRGGPVNTGSGGCQTMAPGDFTRFYSLLKPHQPHFLYVLVTAVSWVTAE